MSLLGLFCFGISIAILSTECNTQGWQTSCRVHVVRHWVNVFNICKHMLQMDFLEVFPS